MKKFLAEYWIELIAALVAFIGIYVVMVKPRVEFSIPAMTSWVVTQFNQTKYLISNFFNLHVIDVIDFLIVCLCILFIIWRFRVRLLKSKLWNATTCPRCGNRLNRVHRSRLDRVLSKTLLPHARRYRCHNPACSWTGLRNLKFKDPLKIEESSVQPE